MIPMGVQFRKAGSEQAPLWPELNEKNSVHTQRTIEVAVLDGGMASGRPSLMLRIEVPGSGKVVLAETSARLFCAVAKAIMIRYPDLFEGE